MWKPSGDLETLILLVEEVGGLTLLPEVALWTLPRAKRLHLRPLSPPGVGRTVYLLVREGSLKAPVARALGEEVKGVFRELRLKGWERKSVMMGAEDRHGEARG